MNGKTFTAIGLALSILLCGCAVQNDAAGAAGGQSDETVYTASVGSKNSMSADEQYAELTQDTLREAFLELEGVKDAKVHIAYAEDSVEVTTDLTYAEGADQEKTKETVEAVLQKFFADDVNAHITVN